MIRQMGMRIHKVGSVSAGASLILFGCAFFAHTFFDVLNYTLILKFRPLIPVSLGTEILLSRNKEQQEKAETAHCQKDHPFLTVCSFLYYAKYQQKSNDLLRKTRNPGLLHCRQTRGQQSIIIPLPPGTGAYTVPHTPRSLPGAPHAFPVRRSCLYRSRRSDPHF